MDIYNILNNDTVKILLVLFIILQCANVINLSNILLSSNIKKTVYNILLILLIIYYLKLDSNNCINIGICILVVILIIKNINSNKKENNIKGGNNINEDELLHIQKEVLNDTSENNLDINENDSEIDNNNLETNDSNDEYDDYDASGGKDMKDIDKELNKVYKEYLKEKKEMGEKKEEFKDLLVKTKLAKNIKKIEDTTKLEEDLSELNKIEKQYKKLSTLMEGGEEENESKLDNIDFSKEVARIAEIKNSVEKNKKLYDLNKDGKLNMNDMPDKKQINKYKAEIDKIMDEEKDLFNLSEESPILEEWSNAFKNNFNVKKTKIKNKKTGGNTNKEIKDIVNNGAEYLGSKVANLIKGYTGGYNELKTTYAKIDML